MKIRQPRHISIIWHFITLVTFIMATILVITYIFWAIYPYKLVDIKEPIPILNYNHQVKVGEQVIMQLYIKKYQDITPDKADVYLLCSDGSLIQLQAKTAGRPKGEYNVVIDSYRVPEKTPIGLKCTFNFRNSYQVNPVREIVKNWSSEQFEVIK